MRYKYEVYELENSATKTLNTSEMIQKAKTTLKANKSFGLDRGVTQKDLNQPINAWVYLCNVGIGTTTNRKEW